MKGSKRRPSLQNHATGGRLLVAGALLSVGVLACGDGGGGDGEPVVTADAPLSVGPGEPVDVAGITVALGGFELTQGSSLDAGYANLVHSATGLDGDLVVEEGGLRELLADMVAPYELADGSRASATGVPFRAGNVYIGQYVSSAGHVLMAVGRAEAGRYLVLTVYNIEGVDEAEGESLGRDAGTAVSTASFSP